MINLDNSESYLSRFVFELHVLSTWWALSKLQVLSVETLLPKFFVIIKCEMLRLEFRATSGTDSSYSHGSLKHRQDRSLMQFLAPRIFRKKLLHLQFLS